MKTNRLKSKHSQVTIFIIIAVVIIAIALLIIFYPKLKLSVTPQTPTDFVQSCVEQSLTPLLENITSRGGNLNPENYILYQDNKIEYLCYTNENYKTCTMQQPILKQQIESEVKENIKDRVNECLNLLVIDYQNKGYKVSKKNGDVEVSLIPRTIKVTVNSEVSINKESSQRFERFNIVKNSDVYDLIMIAESILNWEARYGDSVAEDYMLFYPNLKVEKLKQGDGSKIYILTSRDSDEKFVFATRSLVIPPGLTGGTG